MRKFLIIVVIITFLLLVVATVFNCVNAYAQCEGSSCTRSDVAVQNSIQHEQNSVIYYNNNARSSNFVYPHSPHRVYLPTYFTDHGKHSSNYIAILNVIQFKDTFTRAELEKLLEGGDVEVTSHLIYEASVPTESITVLFPYQGVDTPSGVYNGTFVGIVDDSNDGTTSIHAFAAACLKAMDAGANVAYINQEGAERVLRSFGGGVGFSYTRASIGADGNNSGVASGGTGFSWGSAEYEEEPFIHITGLTMTVQAILDRKNAIKTSQQVVVEQPVQHTNGDQRKVLQNRKNTVEGNLP